MDEHSIQQFLLGLPESGKSTFLAALWHVVVEQDVPGALQFSHLAGDKTYLNNLTGAWANVEKLERTKLGMGENLQLELKHPKTGETTCIKIPDLSGESLQQQWVERVAEIDYANIVSEASGGLLLIHPDLREESLVTDAESLSARIADTERATLTPDTPEPWSAEKTPTQVQLVELLQVVCSLTEKPTLRLAVVVSAWDRVDQGNPEQWLKDRAPLLLQFLESNQDRFECKYFGLSAQGGDIDEQDSKVKLQEIAHPSKRIQLVSAESPSTNDITFPLRWIMRWD